MSLSILNVLRMNFRTVNYQERICRIYECYTEGLLNKAFKDTHVFHKFTFN